MSTFWHSLLSIIFGHQYRQIKLIKLPLSLFCALSFSETVICALKSGIFSSFVRYLHSKCWQDTVKAFHSDYFKKVVIKWFQVINVKGHRKGSNAQAIFPPCCLSLPSPTCLESTSKKCGRRWTIWCSVRRWRG